MNALFRESIVAVTFVACCWWTPAVGQVDSGAENKRSSGGIVAHVGNEVITQAELDEQTEQFRDELVERFPPGVVDREWQRLQRTELDRLIQDRMVLQLVRRREQKDERAYVSQAAIDAEIASRIEDLRSRGVRLNDAEDLYAYFRQSFGIRRDQVRKRLREQMSIQKFFWQEVFTGISGFVKPKEARYYYQANLDEFTTPVEVSFRMIVISRGRADAMVAAENVEKGLLEGKNFGDLAAQWSDDAVLQGSPERARTRVWNKSFEDIAGWAEPLPDALRTLKKGEVSGRLDAPRRIHFIRVEDVLTGNPKKFSEVQFDIEKRILRQRRQRAQVDFLRRLRERTRVEILLPSLPNELDDASEVANPGGAKRGGSKLESSETGDDSPSAKSEENPAPNGNGEPK